jgi:hypothetical protein
MSKPIDPQLAELIAHQEQSGLSVAAYAREHNLPKWKLYEARRSLRERDSEFIEIDVGPADVGDSPLEIVFPGDLRVRVPHDFDAACLRRLVGVLSPC